MSLGGLAVAIGLIIDDTVVVIENIARHLSLAGSRRAGETHRSGVAGLGEITGAVIGSTLTTVLVFVPLAFITGVYGQFFASLSWSLWIAVLVSMVISLTLVPVFAGSFWPADRCRSRVGFTAVAKVYDAVLGVALAFPWATLTLSVVQSAWESFCSWACPITGRNTLMAKRRLGPASGARGQDG